MREQKQSFHDFLSANNIVCRPQAKDGREVINLLLNTLKRHFPSLDIAKATHDVLAREELFSTVITSGLAVPHARLENLSSPLIAMACSPDGFSFGAPGEKVKVMILLLTPMDNPNLHMQLLAALASDFSKADAIETVAGLSTPLEVVN
ncbi:MAG: PTS sugar transporter subunit IIA, partial [Victivallaceae bacterium]|nr:PTS sugar transporter subunit IIA [Victivallaceae bacterium]